jgi:choline dehydrogenase-like flavoprotein
MTEALPSQDAGFSLSDDGLKLLSWPRPNKKTFTKLRRLAVDLFRSAGYCVLTPPRINADWHVVGTARMGNDPGTSVINSHCQAHDIDGLYIVDASSLPRAGAINTGLTIAALALRAAEMIQKNLRNG